MDTLTHALSGALLARATEPSSYAAGPRADQLPRRVRMWGGFWAAAFPDSDFVLRFIDPLTYLTEHRGVTHSLILLPLWAIGLAFLFSLIARRRYSWKAFVGTCALGIGIHIAGDVITAFGTMVFAPVSSWRAQFPTTFIIDLWFTGIIVAGLLAAAYWKQRRAPAVLGLLLLLGYVGFGAVARERATKVGDAYIAARHLESAQADALPQPFSPFNWMVVVAQPKTYHLSYVSLARNDIAPQPAEDSYWLRRVYASYRPLTNTVWQHVQRDDEQNAGLVELAWNAGTMAGYRHFAQFPAVYRVDRGPEHTCVWFHDVRFLLAGRTMPFRFGACREKASSPWKVFQLTSGDNGHELLEAIPD